MSTTEKPFIVSIDTPKESFKNHLEIPFNDRILFSGKFGMGKTYFLKEYFNEHPEKYNTFHLFPVNYSIAKTDDIFKFIKYNLLYDLIENKDFNIFDDFETVDYDTDIFDIAAFIKENPLLFLTSIVSFIPSIGKTAASVIKEFKKSWEDFRKKSHENLDELDVRKITTDFTAETSNHYLFENDIVTQVIENSLQRFKNDGKKNVLIIDDLDRIDPEHIFRILNIFAAYADNNHNGNESNIKFGFDKIIIVLDIDNIRNIFHNKYGGDVDFNGYIDKFYSIDIFIFNNTQSIYEAVADVMNGYACAEQLPVEYQEAFALIKNNLANMLRILILTNTLSIRTLKKFGSTYRGQRYVVDFGEKEFENFQIPVLLIIDFLESIFGSYEGLVKVLERCKSKISKLSFSLIQNEVNSLFGSFFILLDADRNKFTPRGDHRFRGNNGSIFEYDLLEEMTSNPRLKLYYSRFTSTSSPSLRYVIENIEEGIKLKNSLRIKASR